MTFSEIRKEVIAENEKQLKSVINYITIGRLDPDAGIQAESTARRWEQYKNGEITREQAITYAVKRAEKASAKALKKKLDKIAAVENAANVSSVSVYTHWNRNYYWGYNPVSCAFIGAERGTIQAEGRASGCGYDKYSAAVAEAFNASNEMLKILYAFKEYSLLRGVKRGGDSVSNEAFVDYGAGYGALPYFEGGVGIGCFERILRKAGYEVRSDRSGRHDDALIAWKNAETIFDKLEALEAFDVPEAAGN